MQHSSRIAAYCLNQDLLDIFASSFAIGGYLGWHFDCFPLSFPPIIGSLKKTWMWFVTAEMQFWNCRDAILLLQRCNFVSGLRCHRGVQFFQSFVILLSQRCSPTKCKLVRQSTILFDKESDSDKAWVGSTKHKSEERDRESESIDHMEYKNSDSKHHCMIENDIARQTRLDTRLNSRLGLGRSSNAR